MTMTSGEKAFQQATHDAQRAIVDIKSLIALADNKTVSDVELRFALERLWMQGYLHALMNRDTSPATPNEAKQEASAFKAGAEAMLSHLIRAARPYGFRFVSAHPTQERATAFASFLAELTRFTGLPPDEFQDIALFHAENIPDVRDLRDVGITPAVTSPIDDDLDRLRSKQSPSLI